MSTHKRVLRQRRLTERHERQFNDIRRNVISIGVQLEELMIECGYLEPDKRQVRTSEMIKREDGSGGG